jgi:hypothetical protein
LSRNENNHGITQSLQAFSRLVVKFDVYPNMTPTIAPIVKRDGLNMPTIITFSVFHLGAVAARPFLF